MDICNNCKYFDMYSPRTLTGMCTCHDHYNLDASAPACYLFEDKEENNLKEIEKLKACIFAVEQAMIDGQAGCFITVGKSKRYVDWDNLRDELIRDVEEVQNDKI